MRVDVQMPYDEFHPKNIMFYVPNQEFIISFEENIQRWYLKVSFKSIKRFFNSMIRNNKMFRKRKRRNGKSVWCLGRLTSFIKSNYKLNIFQNVEFRSESEPESESQSFQSTPQPCFKCLNVPAVQPSNRYVILGNSLFKDA